LIPARYLNYSQDVVALLCQCLADTSYFLAKDSIMKTQQTGFSLIELMITVAIIGILLSMANSSYQDYTIRSQIAEGLNMADHG
jgi:prepilin-type N-terminal cleavage/methylation domain-containing protein